MGGYDSGKDIYRVYDADSGLWGPVIDPPSRPPGMKIKEKEKVQAVDRNFGIDLSRLNGSEKPYYTLSGGKSCRAEVIDALENVQDDSNKDRLVIIGTGEQRQKVMDDLASASELAPFKDTFLVQSYSPDAWAVADAGFVRSGNPTIYCQRPDGRVLHRQDAYTGPALLAMALRRTRPDYDPSKDPDLTVAKPAPPTPPDSGGSGLLIPGIVFAVMAGLFLFLRTRAV